MKQNRTIGEKNMKKIEDFYVDAEHMDINEKGYRDRLDQVTRLLKSGSDLNDLEFNEIIEMIQPFTHDQTALNILSGAVSDRKIKAWIKGSYQVEEEPYKDTIDENIQKKIDSYRKA